MPSKKELIANEGLIESDQYPSYQKERAETLIEAMMKAGPNEPPTDSHEEMALLREAVVNAFDMLPAKEQFVIESELFERLSLMQVARRINRSKTQARRIRMQGLALMREYILEDPEIAREVAKWISN